MRASTQPAGLLLAALLSLLDGQVSQAQPPRLDSYGDPLPKGVLLRLGRLRFRAENPIQSLCVSPNGKLVAAGMVGPHVHV